MSQYEMYQVINVPKQLLKQQANLKISDAEMLVLIKLISGNNAELNFVELSKEWSISRDVLMSLSNKGLINVSEKMGQIVVDINPLFTRLNQGSTQESNLGMTNTQTSQVETEVLTSDKLDRISFLLNRRINNMELEKLKEWLNLGYTIPQIEVAIQKSTINQVDNFNYIEKVLLNSTERKEAKVSKIQRNIDLY